MGTSTWTQSKKLLRKLEIIEHWTSTGMLLFSLFHWGLGTLEEEEEKKIVLPEVMEENKETKSSKRSKISSYELTEAMAICIGPLSVYTR